MYPVNVRDLDSCLYMGSKPDKEGLETIKILSFFTVHHHPQTFEAGSLKQPILLVYIVTNFKSILFNFKFVKSLNFIK